MFILTLKKIEMCDNQINNIVSSGNIQTMEDLFNYFDNFEAYSRSLLDNNNEIPFNPFEWRITNASNGKIRPPQLHEFLLLLLNNSRYNSYASWLDKDDGLFKFHQPNEVVNLWTKVKIRPTKTEMNYEKFSRAIRTYYDKGIMVSTRTKYTYRFVTHNE